MDGINTKLTDPQVLTFEQKAYNRILKEAKHQEKFDAKAALHEEGSLLQLRASLSSVTSQYAALGKEERDGGEGKALKKQINEITTRLTNIIKGLKWTE